MYKLYTVYFEIIPTISNGDFLFAFAISFIDLASLILIPIASSLILASSISKPKIANDLSKDAFSTEPIIFFLGSPPSGFGLKILF